MVPGPTSIPTCPASRETDSWSGPLARAVVALVWEGGTVVSHLPETLSAAHSMFERSCLCPQAATAP